MKLDKETVVKHQFWFLLGGFVLLWFIGLISLKVAAAGPIAAKKKQFTDTLTAVNGARSKAKNERFWTPWKEYGDKYQGYKNDAWVMAWTLQNFKYVEHKFVDARNYAPRFEEVEVDAKTKKEAPLPDKHYRRRFRNYYFEIDFVIGPEKEGKPPVLTKLSTIKNILPLPSDRVLPLANPYTNEGLPFFLVQKDDGHLFRIDGSPLTPRADKATPFTKSFAVAGIDLNKSFKVVQGFDWYYIPFETWPGKLDGKMLYPPDPMTNDDRIEYQQAGYALQWDENLEKLASPVQYTGGFSAVFPQHKFAEGKPPTREEIWLLQEDFWVRREMIYMLREAMNSIAVFEEIKVDAKKEASLPENHVRHRFRNYYFEIDLVIDPGKDGKLPVITKLSTIRNVSKDNRVLPLANPRTNKGIPFSLYQGGSKVVFRLEGEPLAPQAKNATSFTKSYPVTGVDPRKPFALVQEFDLENSPIRSVVEITLAKNCSRLEKVALKPRDVLKALDAVAEAPKGEEKPEGTGTTSPGMSGGAPGMAPGGMRPPGGGMQQPNQMMGQPGGGAQGSKAPAADLTLVNKIDRLRYLHVTPQCRQLPIKLRLIIEQPHIKNVLAAIENNRLRIQITQVAVSHVGSIKASTGISDFVPGEQPQAGRKPPGMSPGMPPGMPPGMSPRGPGAGFPGSGGGPPSGMTTSPTPPRMTPARGSGAGPTSPTPPGMGPGRRPGMPAGGAPSTTAKPATLKDPNMVELTVYGIVALYERFPPKAPPASTTEGGETKP